MSPLQLPNELNKYVDPIAPKCFVYFISEGEYTKIGFARDIEKRLKDLQVANPRKLWIVSFVPCLTEYHARKIEKFLHHSLKFHRVHGEWFKLPACFFVHENLSFAVNYDDWRLAQYEMARRAEYKRKYYNV